MASLQEFVNEEAERERRALAARAEQKPQEDGEQERYQQNCEFQEVPAAQEHAPEHNSAARKVASAAASGSTSASSTSGGVQKVKLKQREVQRRHSGASDKVRRNLDQAMDGVDLQD